MHFFYIFWYEIIFIIKQVLFVKECRKNTVSVLLDSALLAVV